MPSGVPTLRAPSWLHNLKEDLHPAPGRLENCLRIVLATVLVLLTMQVLQVPFMAYALYVILMVSNENPSVSLRIGIACVLAVTCVLSIALIVVILTDNDPAARVLSLAVMTFAAGMITAATALPAIGPIWGLIYAVAIGFWEDHAPADALVKNSLWLLAALLTGIGGAIAVGYVFALRSPADRLAQQLRRRYQALAAMFEAFGDAASTQEQRLQTAQMVSRIAAEGHRGMLELHHNLVERKLPLGRLPPSVHAYIITAAELMDGSAAFGLQLEPPDQEQQSRCRMIAQQCDYLARELRPKPEFAMGTEGRVPQTHLDRVETIMRSLQSIPIGGDDVCCAVDDLPAEKLSLLIPGAMSKMENIAFALKISLCATLCYIIYHAIDWPGIATAVTTVMVAGLVNTGAMKQKLTHRLMGATIGGLILGLGAEVFLFPFMDSITSLVIVVALVALLSAWVASGPRFSYAGLQIAFAFYFVSLSGFRAPLELAPARDRLAGILLGLLVLWLVFDQIWPVRTISTMRRVVASVLRDAARAVALVDTRLSGPDSRRESGELRDRLAKELTAVRTLNDAAQYEFGPDRQEHMRAGNRLQQISMTAVALVWNQVTLISQPDEAPTQSGSTLIALRETVAQRLLSIAEVFERGRSGESKPLELAATPDESTSEYARNTIARYNELKALALSVELRD